MGDVRNVTVGIDKILFIFASDFADAKKYVDAGDLFSARVNLHYILGAVSFAYSVSLLNTDEYLKIFGEIEKFSDKYIYGFSEK